MRQSSWPGPRGGNQFQYDVLHRFTREFTYDPVTHAFTGSTLYSYDNADRLTLVQPEDVNHNFYYYYFIYDNANRLTEVTGPKGAAYFGYDAGGRRTSEKLPNGLVGCYSYDAANDLTSIAWYASGTSCGAIAGGTYQQEYVAGSCAAPGSPIGNLVYTYDGAGRVASRCGTLFISQLPATVAASTYDIDDRLLTWNGTGSGTSFTYDANGNMLTAGTGATYTWDARNRLIAIGGSYTAAFHYDPLNRRATAAIGSTTRAFGNAGLNVALEQQGTTVTAQMVPGPGVDERYARATTTGTAGTYSLLSDGLGSVVALADSTGAIQTTYGYDPYGNTTAYAPANDNPYQFTGRENDGTGLYNDRNRYYAPQWGRC